MQFAGGRRGIGTVALSIGVVGVIIVGGTAYYLAAIISPHGPTDSHSEVTTTQNSDTRSSETSTVVQSTWSTASSNTFSSPADSTTTETGQTSNTYPQTQINMVVNQTIVDQAQACYGSLECNEEIYIFNMTVRNTGNQEFYFNELNLNLRTNGTALYGVSYLVYAIQSPASGRSHELPSSAIPPRGKIAGEEGFEVPNNEVPTQLVYKDAYSGVNVTAVTPSPTSWVSEVVTFGAASIGPQDLECGNSGNINQPVCFTATYAGMNSSHLGSADYFTGEKMGFTITITLGAGSGSPGTVLVHSDVVGFDITGITAPECLGGSSSCTNWVVDVYMVAQPGLSYYGTPALTVILQPA
jgi:hypothetical protein